MNILLIQIKRIGDLVLTTPAISALRQKFPAAELTLVLSRESAELGPAIPGIDKFLVTGRRPLDLARMFPVAGRKFDYCIDFTRNDRSAFISFLSRARKRVVSGRLGRKSKLRRRAYNEFVRRRIREMHTIDHNLALLEPLGIKNTSPAPRLALPPPAHESATAVRLHAKFDRPFIIFHPGSARAEKFWEPRRWAEVVSHATAEGFTAALTGGISKSEKGHLAQIQSELTVRERQAQSIVDLSGKIDLLTLTALIAQARLVVTVDTAPMHLAAATGTPQVVLFGPTNPFHWYPRDSPALILQGPSQHPIREFLPDLPPLPMRLISTRAVIDAMDALLSAPVAQAL